MGKEGKGGMEKERSGKGWERRGEEGKSQRTECVKT